MARKDDVTPIHPVKIMNALQEYLAEVRYMQGVMDNAHRFLSDESLDPAKVVPVVAEQIKTAIDRMDKWRNA